MNSALPSKTVFLLTGLIAALFLTFNFGSSYFNRRTRLVFCDVGQGDGAYLRLDSRIDILIDAGPDAKILTCLGKYMPFYDRTIEMMIISHPQTDHVGGLAAVMKHYQINEIVTAYPSQTISSKTWNSLKKQLLDRSIYIHYIHIVNSPQTIDRPNARFTFISPVFRSAGSDENDSSLVVLLQVGSRKILFTGDVSGKVLRNYSRLNIDIIKVPHHGSKTGLDKKFYSLAHPTIAVISVGRKNSYGHPSPVLLELLKALKINVKRTDKDGDVVFNF